MQIFIAYVTEDISQLNSFGKILKKMRSVDKIQITILKWLIFFGLLIWLIITTINGVNQGLLFFDISSLLISSIYLGALYLCISLGLTMTYKLIGFANFAHAEYFLVGAYTGIEFEILFKTSYYSLYLVIILGFIVAGIAALLSDFFVFEPLRKRNSSAETLMISSIGVGIIIRNVVSLFFGGKAQYYIWNVPNNLPFPFNVISRPQWQIRTVIISATRDTLFTPDYYYLISQYQITIYVTIILVTSLMVLLQYTKTGKALRATSDNRDLAENSGIDTNKMIRLTWFVGGGLAGVAGVLYSIAFAVIPLTGFIFLLPAFAVVVFGGVGSLKGSIVASFLIAFTQALSVTYLVGITDLLASTPYARTGLSAYQRVVPFFIIIVVLLFKPYGLYGDKNEL